MRSHRILVFVLLFALAPLARGQTFELLHSFNGSDGAQPLAELLQGREGNIYGTTFYGGAEDQGTVFKITTDGVMNTLVSFNSTNGAFPYGALLQAVDGNLYGTTSFGGVGGGTVFKMTTNGVLTSLVLFDGSNGANPFAGLIQASNDIFFGTTYYGGTNGSGTVFRMTADGSLSVLASFGPNVGWAPRGELTQGTDGNFYGTTQYGETNVISPLGWGYGTTFRITPEGTLTSVISFKKTDGAYPFAGLTLGSDGSLYGTTTAGGVHNKGTVFKLMADDALTPLFSFNFTNDGGGLESRLLQASDGKFYGTTQFGGSNDYGTVFQMTATGELTTLISFSGTNGCFPVAGLVEGTDGNLYGVAAIGGLYDKGTIFRIVMPVSLSSRVSGNELVLSWPTNALGFALQSSADLNSPTNWIDSTNAPAVVGAHFTVTNNLSGSAQFYRLKKP